MIVQIEKKSGNDDILLFIVAIGFTNGSVRILDGLLLKEEGHGDGLAVFNHCHDCVTNIKFSHDSNYLATCVSIYNKISGVTIKKKKESSMF